ncbi:hypothetical protein D5Y30_06415 [Salmonella enterica subsp. enterica serovar Oranienburg]|nr:hypothetical protein [Salmonella enterica subsp. enterica serovar Oranienburg]
MAPKDFAAEAAPASCFLNTGCTNILMYRYVNFNVTTPPDYVKFSRNGQNSSAANLDERHLLETLTRNISG